MSCACSCDGIEDHWEWDEVDELQRRIDYIKARMCPECKGIYCHTIECSKSRRKKK